MTPRVVAAWTQYRAALGRAYPTTLKNALVFGSRARGDAFAHSDLDVVVILAQRIDDLFGERMKLADLAYDTIVETGVHVQPSPVSASEWEQPDAHARFALLHAMKRDARDA